MLVHEQRLTRVSPDATRSHHRYQPDRTRADQFGRQSNHLVVSRELEQLERDLATAIRGALITHRVDEEICALALAYSDGQYGLPPAVFACPTSLRSELLELGDHPWYLWQAAEWMSLARHRHVTLPALDPDYGHPDLRTRCAAIKYEIDQQERGELAPSSILRAVARRLNYEPWPATLQRSTDFVAYAWDVTGGLLEEDLAWSVPAERLEQFLQRRWL